MAFDSNTGGAPLGNDNALKGKPWRDALNRALAQDDEGRLRKAAESLLTLASEGEAWAVKELADRLDGKPQQDTTIANPDGSPLLKGITVFFGRIQPDSGVPPKA